MKTFEKQFLLFMVLFFSLCSIFTGVILFDLLTADIIHGFKYGQLTSLEVSTSNIFAFFILQTITLFACIFFFKYLLTKPKNQNEKGINHPGRKNHS